MRITTRVCDLCGRKLETDRIRFLKVKDSVVLYYNATEGRSYLEAKDNNEIHICENCQSQPISSLFQLVEKHSKAPRDNGSAE